MKIGSFTTSYPANIARFKKASRQAQRAMLKLMPKFSCPCCNVTTMHPRLACALEKLMELFDPERLKVHSGYRCAEHNRTVKGSPTSRHLTGQAIDFHIIGVSLDDMHEVVSLIPEFRGIGKYPDWNNPGLHCDVRSERKEWIWKP